MGRMRTIRHNFDEVAITPERSGTCAKCGKPCRRKKKFFQTINPFNLNDQGKVKTAGEIRAELTERFREWCKQPLYHAKCED